MNQLDSMAADCIEQCVEQGYRLEASGLEKEAAVMFDKAYSVANTMDGEDDVFYCTYWRYESESFGVDFEQEHGDPELMFGGILDAQD